MGRRHGQGRGVRRWLAAAALAVTGMVAVAAQAAPGLTIGAIVPRSWPNPADGEDIVAGMQLAIKTWPGNEAPRLVIHDSGCRAERADAAARELVAAKVDVVLGSWCVIGQAPRIVAEAGVPYISAHPERLQRPPAGVLQLGRIEVYQAEQVAARLRQETGLRVSARTACWMDFRPVVREPYDAVLCPVVGMDAARWQQAEATFTAAHRRPFTWAVARGYAAMEAALAQMRRLRTAGRSNGPLPTVLGPVPAADAPAPADALQLVLAPQLPRLSARDAAAVQQLLQTKACCPPGAACAPRGPWAELPFEVRGTTAACPVRTPAAAP